MTIIIILLLLLFYGCEGIIPSVSPPPVIITSSAPLVQFTMTPTYTPTQSSEGEISPTPTLNFAPPTWTPTPTPTVDPQNVVPPCDIIIRQPPTNAPTRIPDPLRTPAVGDVIDAHTAYCVSTLTPQVGDVWQIYVRAVAVGLPEYRLTFTNIEGEQLYVSFNPGMTRDNSELESNLSALTFVSVQPINTWDAIFTFTINEADEIRVEGGTSGELHYGYPGPATWTFVNLDPFVLTISE